MKKVQINTEYIKLDQFLKWTGEVESGAFAKEIIADGKIKVNDEIELRRGRKIRKGDVVKTDNEVYEVY